MKICIDPGHGGFDQGALGLKSKEKDINLTLALVMGRAFQKHDVKIIYTRTSDKYLSLQERCDIANKSKCDYFISIHCNSSSNSGDSGSMTYYSDKQSASERLAKSIQEFLITINNNKDLGSHKKLNYTLYHTSMPSVQLQAMYITNPIEEMKLLDEVWQDMFGSGFVLAFLQFIGWTSKLNQENQSLEKKGRTAILGEALATAEQMEAYVHRKNPDAPYLAKLYLSIGKEEGVRGDIAFSQTIVETNFLKKCTDEYARNKNNFANISIFNHSKEEYYFETPVDGVRAHIQHLKAYASTDKLNTPLTDPVFHLVKRGAVQYWEELDDNWFVFQEGYGQRVVQVWREIMQVTQTDPAEEIYNQWREQGILLENIELDQPITWRDYLLLQNRLLKKTKEGGIL